MEESKDDETQKQVMENQKPPEPPKDYIHVRARRGQATDSHSLAERVSINNHFVVSNSKNILVLTIFFSHLIR